MATPKALPQDSAFRTTWQPAGRRTHARTHGYRKFPFETEAADATGCAAVASERLLKEIEADCLWEQRAPGAPPYHLVTMTSVVKTVYALQPPSVLNGSLPADRQSRVTSKSLLPVKTKLLHSGGSEAEMTKIIKPRRENGQTRAADTATRKNAMKSYKPLIKQKPEEELKDKNQLLESVNKQLHLKLTETQGELKDLTQKVELLEKFQDNCLAILESKGMHPGSEALGSQQESSPDHTDSVLLLETLQDELQLFNETAKKQMEELQALKVKLKTKEEERLRFLEQQSICNNKVNDFTTALQEMEQLLEM
ncbi:small kinetochore-associated protein [Echinops telfairi]|uniref:Small kinetochore-associated protein n=1 Tax=Echinops telfairi TaxID=9371 RepID=A0ABM0ZSW4_ECHTE|nr:small kinetochore-associated protein [Echinops telfairi]